jgi:hypothetical protein
MEMQQVVLVNEYNDGCMLVSLELDAMLNSFALTHMTLEAIREV